jgi:hypothetical protein
MEPLEPAVGVPDDLLEVRNMLVTRMEKWVQQQRLELDERVREAVQHAKQLVEQQAEERGRQRGEQLGEQRGRQQGEAGLLLRQLERRFGVLPDGARDRVLTADIVTIEEWALRVLDAATLEEVLA